MRGFRPLERNAAQRLSIGRARFAGTAYSIVDLETGFFSEGYSQGPTSGGDGFDGKRAWMRDQSGAITPEEGGDKAALALNNAYRNANLWWRGDRGGAAIENLGTKPGEGHEYEVLRVTPRGGKPFEAWFDAATHLLTKTVEVTGFIPIITTFSDYRLVSGVMLAHKIVSDSGGGDESLETQTITGVRVGPAQEATHYAAPAWSRADTHIDGKATTIPFVLLNNHVFVDVMVNDKGPYRFIVDTGGHDIVTPSTVAALGLNAQGDSPAHGAGEATVSSGYAKVHSLRLGAVTIRDQTMTVLDFDAPGVEGVSTDGMIGFEIFRRFVTTFDYASNQLTLTDPKHFDASHAGKPVRFKFYDHMPQIDGSIDGIDGPGKSYSVRGHDLQLGGVRGDTIIIGLSTQDSGQIMYLKPRAGSVGDAGTFDRTGMWVNAAGNGFQIMDLWATGPAQIAGLRVGDVIEGVDGHSVVMSELSDFRRRLRTDAAGSKVKLQVSTAGSQREVTLTLADQI